MRFAQEYSAVTKSIRIIPLIFFLSGSTLFSSCSKKTPVFQQQYGVDAEYYQGLRSIQEGNEAEAEKHFRNCSKNGSKYTARRSAEALTQLGNVQERIEACANLVKTYHDEDALLRSASELTQDGEFAQVILQTDTIDISEYNNKLVWFRINAMQKKSDTRLSETVYQWFTTRPIGPEHYKFYTEALAGSQRICDINQQIIITFRVAAYRKSYISAYKQLSSVISVIESDGRFIFTQQLISDMGKVSLYGSSLWSKNAKFFDGLAERAESSGNRENAFYSRFYAARLYDKGGSYYPLAAQRYTQAMDDAPTTDNFDNTLWYRLNMDLAVSTDNALSTLQTYRGKWHNPEYFADFFDTLAVLLLSNREWNDFYRVYTIIDGFADDSTAAKYAYLSGRLIENNLADTGSSPSDATDAARAAFTRALNSGSDTYYKILAADRLGLSGSELEKVFYNTQITVDFKADAEAETLLSGYAVFGFPQYIYPEWQKITGNGISIGLDCSSALANFLRNCDDSLPDHYAQSLRIISKAAAKSDRVLSKGILELFYPQNFHKMVVSACTQFGLKEYLLYALIRSESLFDPDIESYVGATGLTQLMESTAGDIAKKLKMSDYNLNDPETNIKFGAYYLCSLIQRLDNSDILALLAYNSGITRVRSWVSDSRLELGSKSKLPMDLFLETIPFAETREYGRKTVSAAVMYGWLYYDTTPNTVINEIFK